MFIYCHSSFNSCDYLADLYKNTISDSAMVNDLKIHHKCGNIVKNVISPYFLEDLIFDIGQEKFCLLLGESIHITVSKLLGITVIYYSKLHKKLFIPICIWYH